ncbi:hypothetical protein [Lutibacter sp. B1]|uniref:hypothetical protein n=1 Tax=Lutibacter sp. B1 TaxID=2725996 RepID=UPI001456B237|nr:hypothetical protein [Lutibacter sp. B1]NLP56893.1 hypothetical protein [Lutibacter sp. B1]
MKQIKILISSLLILGIGFVITSCESDDHSLGDMLDKSEIDYEIIQDYSVDPGGNTVILKNNTPEIIITWDYGTGRSNKAVETVRYAFKGDYLIKVSAVTAGGIVELDPVTITVTEDNLNYVNDELWTALSGGVGNSKTWLLDLNAEGISKYFGGPLYFYGTNNGWLEGGDEGCYGEDCWNWNPDYAGNTWLMPTGDYGSMTFSLDGGPFITTNHLMIPSIGEESGTYFLDKDNHILTLTDASILHDEGRDACVDNWGDITLFSLTENTMQLGVMRRDDCEGAALLVYNFISKDYSDNWVAEDLPDPTPAIDLNGGTLSDLIAVTSTKTWSLSPDSPFDWTDLEGNLLNGWETVEDYPDWASYTSADQATVSSNKIIFSADGTVKTVNSDGDELEGSYTVEEGTNIISFSDITPSFNMGGWAVATTTSQNQWKIVKTAMTGSTVTDIWFGKRDETGKDEYMVFHFVLGSSSVDPIEEARKLIVASLTGPTGTRTFKVSDTWHVDWLNADLSGGWTSASTFADDFTSNSWVWTEAVKAGLQDPTLTFTANGSDITVTKIQDGVTTSTNVIINPEDNTLEIDMDLIAFTDAASWLPTYGPIWYICKVPLTAIETDGLWLGDLNDEETEVTAIHYIISE